MNEKTETKTELFSKNGNHVMTFIVEHRNGSHDYGREGRDFNSITLADGRIFNEYELEESRVEGITYTKKNERMGKYETVTESLTLSLGIQLPILVNITEVDDYYPDYYNEFGGNGQGEFAPTLNSRDIVIKLVKE